MGGLMHGLTKIVATYFLFLLLFIGNTTCRVIVNSETNISTIIPQDYKQPTARTSLTFMSNIAATLQSSSLFTPPSVTSLFQDFEATVDAVNKCAKQQMDNEQLWVHKKPVENFYTQKTTPFTPFVRKVTVPITSKLYCWGDLHGGFHSLVNAFKHLQKQNILSESLKIIPKNSYFIFLGDFVDRGPYGVEVLYLLMNLYLQNPTRVIFVRGNHEDVRLNKQYGFAHELKRKPIAHTMDQRIKLVEAFYNKLPVACYLTSGLGTVQLCHGGVDISYQPHTLHAHKTAQYELITPENYTSTPTFTALSENMLQKLARYIIQSSSYTLRKIARHASQDHYAAQAYLCYDYLQELEIIEKLAIALPKILRQPKNISLILEEEQLDESLLRPLFCETTSCYHLINRCCMKAPKALTELGFAWSDFLVDKQLLADFDSSCRWAYGKTICEELFSYQGICGVFRAHQHYGSMMEALIKHRGAVALWDHDNEKTTVNLKPNAVCTFQVAPSSGMIDLTYDPVGIVTTAENFTDWTLQKLQLSRKAP